MINTKTEYSSSERTPIALPEMEQLLPPLGAEQFSVLEGVSADLLFFDCDHSIDESLYQSYSMSAT